MRYDMRVVASQIWTALTGTLSNSGTERSSSSYHGQCYADTVARLCLMESF